MFPVSGIAQEGNKKRETSAYKGTQKLPVRETAKVFLFFYKSTQARRPTAATPPTMAAVLLEELLDAT